METIPLFRVFMNEKIDINPVLTSGYITQGQKVEEYEEQLTKYFDYPYILSVNSATSGLTLALRLLNLPAGSEVLSTPLTCFATNCPILANNLSIKWVDIDPNTLNISLDDLNEKITETTKCIVFVHWGGYPIDYDKLHHIVKQKEDLFGHKIHIIEDCAHAFGSRYKNRFVGTFGNISVFSTQAIKHLTTGDGGFIILPDEVTYERAKLLRWFGIDRTHKNSKDFRLENDIKEWGYKFHMNDINASIGLYNLPFISDNIRKIREVADYYNTNLKDVVGVKLLQSNEDCLSSYWLYTIKIVDKSGFINFMKNKNITVSQVHNRNDKHECMKQFSAKLPQLDILENQIVCIPCGWWITEEQRVYIVNCIKEWCFFYIDHISLHDYSYYLDLLSQMNNFNYTKVISEELFEDKLIKMRDNTMILKLCFQKRLVATGKIFIEEKFYQNQAHIEDVVVDKNFRGFGLSKLILKSLIDYAKLNNCYKISLCAKPELAKVYSDFKNVGNHFAIYLNKDN